MTADAGSRGHRLFEGTALAGIVAAFAVPAVLLLRDVDPLVAATCGYAGITVFTGAIAAKFQVITSPSRWMQLLKNTLLAGAVTLLFYAAFLLLYFL